IDDEEHVGLGRDGFGEHTKTRAIETAIALVDDRGEVAPILHHYFARLERRANDGLHVRFAIAMEQSELLLGRDRAAAERRDVADLTSDRTIGRLLRLHHVESKASEHAGNVAGERRLAASVDPLEDDENAWTLGHP